MKKNSKNHHAGRMISLLLALCMVLAIAPITAFAEMDQEITLVDFGNVWKNLDSTKPVVFTTELNPNTDCPNQMEITDQVWLESENGPSLSSGSYPEEGKEYCYYITLTAKEGYFFPTRMVGVFNGTVIIDRVNNDDLYNPAIAFVVDDSLKTLKVLGYPIVTATNGTSQDDYVIDNVVINNAPASCTVGEAPKAMATKGDDEAYTFYEYWEEWVETEEGLDAVKFWYSDAEEMNRVPEDKRITTFEEGKTYSYSIIAKANENYTFASKDDGLSVMLNGVDYTDKSGVFLDGTGLMIGPEFMPSKKPATQKEIELIKIYNPNLSIWAGDEPEFTGAALSDAPYVLEYEGWFGEDGEFICSSDYWNSAYVERGWCDGLISSFKENTEYTYGLYVKLIDEAAARGYVFGPNTKLKINGKEVSFARDNSDIEHLNEQLIEQLNEQIFAVTTGITMTPTAAGTSGQTEGDKTDTTSPQTGDNSNLALWLTVLFVSCGGVIGGTICGRKKKHSAK